jgi:hypothetical protein
MSTRFVLLGVCIVLVAYSISLIVISNYINTETSSSKIVFNLTKSSLEHVNNGIFKRLENDTGETILYMIHEEDFAFSVPLETSCCSYYGDGVHWQMRDMPVKVFQSSSLYLYMSHIEADWKLKTGIDIVGPILESDQEYSETQINAARGSGINTVGYNQIVGDFANALAIARVTLSPNGQHYTHYAIIVNSAFTNICDAVHTPSCYDEKSILNHEFGHCFGLLDEYNPECNLNLMYGSLPPGTIRKRVIDATTIQCAVTLYHGLASGEEESIFNSATPKDYSFMYLGFLGLLVILGR